MCLLLDVALEDGHFSCDDAVKNRISVSGDAVRDGAFTCDNTARNRIIISDMQRRTIILILVMQ